MGYRILQPLAEGECGCDEGGKGSVRTSPVVASEPALIDETVH
jgi:hypothetical protein